MKGVRKRELRQVEQQDDCCVQAHRLSTYVLCPCLAQYSR